MERIFGQLACAAAVSLLLAACQAPQAAVGAIAPASLTAPSGIMVASTVLPSGAVTQTPSGYLAFCKRDPVDCAVGEGEADQVSLAPALWDTLERVNVGVNAAIKPMEDEIHYGRADYWTIPKDGYGDCEDYALAKRKALADAGVSRRALRIAVVQLASGEAHAVLTVATDRGDYVLDNRSNQVLAWHDAGLTWVARQAPGAATWVALGTGRAPMMLAAR
jgi:predicted transglutaminase-like cysteine proteinase